DSAGLDPPREAVPASRVARPDRRHQAVAHVVGDPGGVLLVLERDHRHDRAEDLLLRDTHRVVDPREHGGRVERALASYRFDVPARDDLGAFLATRLDVAVNTLSV